MNESNDNLLNEITYGCNLPLYLKDECAEALANKGSEWGYYSFKVDDSTVIAVPRVSEILDACIGKSYLQSWAAGLGNNYEMERQMILNTGTYTHILIEDFLKYGSIQDENKDFDKMYYREKALKSYSNFVTWWNNMIEQGFKIDVLDIEKTIVCSLYGGTADLVAHIKDPKGLQGNYILDFKTSKAISIDYFYQTVMYMNAINADENSQYKIDGVGIVRCDKFRSSYEYLIINKFKDPAFIMGVQAAVNNMLNWYYTRINAEYEYQLVRDKYLKDDKWV